jgi:hypothetical protein
LECTKCVISAGICVVNLISWISKIWLAAPHTLAYLNEYDAPPLGADPQYVFNSIEQLGRASLTSFDFMSRIPTFDPTYPGITQRIRRGIVIFVFRWLLVRILDDLIPPYHLAFSALTLSDLLARFRPDYWYVRIGIYWLRAVSLMFLFYFVRQILTFDLPVYITWDILTIAMRLLQSQLGAASKYVFDSISLLRFRSLIYFDFVSLFSMF